MELIRTSLAGVLCLITFWVLSGPSRKKPNVININGRHYQIVGTLSDTRVEIRRTLGQWVSDKWVDSWRKIRIALACIGIGACGGAEFQLADPIKPDANLVDAPVGLDAPPVYDDVDPVFDAGPDARLGFKPDASTQEASTLIVEASTQEAASPEASTCAPVAWDCGGAFIPPGRICINHRDAMGISHPTASNPPAACDACPLDCGCILAHLTCGIFNGGPIEYLAGCVERQPNEPEVTCQD